MGLKHFTPQSLVRHHSVDFSRVKQWRYTSFAQVIIPFPEICKSYSLHAQEAHVKVFSSQPQSDWNSESFQYSDDRIPTNEREKGYGTWWCLWHRREARCDLLCSNALCWVVSLSLNYKIIQVPMSALTPSDASAFNRANGSQGFSRCAFCHNM
jgi:hypothetical protein